MKTDYELYEMMRDGLRSCRTPEGYEARMIDLLKNLPEKRVPKRKIGILRPTMIALIVFMVSAVTVAAGVILVRLGKGTLDISDGTVPYQRIVKLKEIQENSGDAYISKTDRGITYTIRNIGLDQGNLILYYTIKTEKEIKFPGEVWESEQIKRKNAAVYPEVKLNHRLLETMPSSNEVYQEDSRTIKGVLRQNISEKLEQKVLLELNVENILGVKGNWKMRMMIDRGDISDESKRYVFGGQMVDSMVLSPLGNTLAIKDGYNNRKIVLRDGEGNYLYTQADSIQEGKISYYNFFVKKQKTSDFEVIPVKETSGKQIKEEKTIALIKGQTMQFSDHTVLKIEKIQKEKELLRIYTKVLSYDAVEFHVGVEGDCLPEIESDGINRDIWMDYEQQLLVFDFYDIFGTEDFRNAKTLKYKQQKIQLDEKNAVKIHLSERFR